MKNRLARFRVQIIYYIERYIFKGGGEGGGDQLPGEGPNQVF